jgi:glycerol-3-phosphate dehydrogenase
MKRDLAALQDTTFDIVVVGGGIYGACIARDAAYRGLTVALVERGDFGHATSHNSLRLIHGGLRYLQHLDLRRIRQSIGEQNYWLKAAPHIVRPLKFMMPTFGLGTRGPAALWAGMQFYRLLAFDRNASLPPASRLRGGGVVSRRALDAAVPGLGSGDVNGGAFWYDAQMVDPDRLQIEVLRDAVARGANVANYVEVTDFLRQSDAVHGVVARELVGDSELEIRGRMTICAAGPWADHLMNKIRPSRESQAPTLTKGMNIVTRPIGPDIGFGVRSARRSDAVIGESRRMYFATPSCGCSIIGTTHFAYKDDPDRCEFTKQDVADFLSEFNAAYPAAELTMDDVLYWHGGLTPADDVDGEDVVRGHQAEIVDHATDDGVTGLISVIGVKYTTARLVAELAVDLTFRKFGQRLRPCSVKQAALPGAHSHEPGGRFPTYGALSGEVEALLPGDADEETASFIACCRYALQHEMAIRIDDLLLRRTMNARVGTLDSSLLHRAADLMTEHLGWDDATRRAETERALTQLTRRGVFLAD